MKPAARIEDGSGRYDHGLVVRAVVAAALLAAANLCVFGAVEILVGNRGEFRSGLSDLLPALVLLAVILAAALVLVTFAMPRRWRTGYAAGLAALGILFWAQGAFLRWGYGEFDGKGIDWAGFTWQGWVDATIWVVVIAAAYRYRDRIVRYAVFLVLAFLVVQTATTWTLASRHTTPVGSHRGEEQDAGRVPPAICQVSRSTNVFHIIMDSFQTDVFLEVLAEEGLEGELDGFTLYRENISAAARTVLSVPNVFSTNLYDGTQTESEYFDRASAGSFLFLLFGNDYIVNLMPHVSMKALPHNNYFPPPAVYAESRRTRVVRDACFLLDVSAFRGLPHFLKRVVYNNQNWRISGIVGDPPAHMSFHQKAFFADYIHHLDASVDEPAYHFIHLMPPHPPFVTLADGTYAGRTLPFDRENCKNESRYMLRLFVQFLDKLRRLGVYDDAVILLHGDHGTGLEPVVPGKNTTERMGRLSALLLLKSPSASGPLKVSNAQTSLSDIPATVMGILGIRHPYPGDSVLDIDAARDRTRRVVFVADRASRAPVVNRFLIRGSVYDESSWHALTPTMVEKRIRDYEWGEKIGFGIGGDGDRYLTTGWSTTSPTIHWNDGTFAEMTMGIEDPGRDVQFEFVFYPYVVEGKVERQRLRVSANGHEFPEAECTSNAPMILRQLVPAELMKDGRLVLTFEFPDAVSPRSLGEGRDTRAISMGLYSFEAHPVEPGEVAPAR